MSDLPQWQVIIDHVPHILSAETMTAVATSPILQGLAQVDAGPSQYSPEPGALVYLHLPNFYLELVREGEIPGVTYRSALAFRLLDGDLGDLYPLLGIDHYLPSVQMVDENTFWYRALSWKNQATSGLYSWVMQYDPSFVQMLAEQDLPTKGNPSFKEQSVLGQPVRIGIGGTIAESLRLQHQLNVLDWSVYCDSTDGWSATANPQLDQPEIIFRTGVISALRYITFSVLTPPPVTGTFFLGDTRLTVTTDSVTWQF